MREVNRGGSGAGIVIVGGGVAGGAAACRLARAGRRVALIERERAAHHKVCGEFLSWEAAADLRDLGLDPAALGAATIDTVRLARDRRVAAAPLPFAAAGLSRHVLDEALLTRAAALGAEIRCGETVRAIEPDGSGCRVALSSGEYLAAPAVFLATGKHDLRGHQRPERARTDRIGFKMHLRLGTAAVADLAGKVDLILFRGGYAGLQLVDNDTANLCLVIAKPRFERLGRSWAALLADLRAGCAHLDCLLAGASPCWPRPLSVSGIPYGFIHHDREAMSAPIFRLGDQLAVIPSFTGDGMAIALHTARLAAQTWLRHGADTRRYHRAARRSVRRPVGIAAALSRLLDGDAAQTAALLGCAACPAALHWTARWTRVHGIGIESGVSCRSESVHPGHPS